MTATADFKLMCETAKGSTMTAAALTRVGTGLAYVDPLTQMKDIAADPENPTNEEMAELGKSWFIEQLKIYIGYASDLNTDSANQATKDSNKAGAIADLE